MGFSKLFKALKDASILGVYIYQDEGRIVYANRAFLSFTGYNEKEIIGKKLPDLLDGEDKKVALKNIVRRLNGEEFSFEYNRIFYKTKNGCLKPSLNFSYTIEYEGKPAGLVIFIDIERQRTYEVLFKSLSEINQLIVRCEDEDELLQSICNILVKNVGFRLAVIGEIEDRSMKFNVKYVSGKQSVVEYFKNIASYVNDALKNKIGTISEAYLDKKITYSENVYEDPKMKRWIDDFKKNNIYSVSSIPIFKKGQPIYMLIIYSDTPNRFSREYLHILRELQLDVSFALDKLEKQRELTLLDEAVNRASDWVVITDADGRIIKANKAVETISGYSIEEIIGNKPSIFKSGEHNENLYKEIWNNIKKGKQGRYRFVNRAKDGYTFYLDSIIIPVFVKGKLYRIVDIARDITTETVQKRKIEKLSSLYKTLSDINELLLESKTKNEMLQNLPVIVLRNLNCKVSFLVDVLSFNRFRVRISASKNDEYGEYLQKAVSKMRSDVYKTPFFRSIQSGDVCVENRIKEDVGLSPFYREQAEKYGFNSCFSMPIIEQGKVVGALVGLMNEPDMFDEQMKSLLEKVKHNIHYALNKLETQKWFNIMSYAVDSGFDFVVITDKDFNIVYVNDKTEEISGYKKSELVGKHHSIFSSKIYNKQFITEFYKTLSSGKIFSGLMVYKSKDLKTVKAITNIMPFKVNGKIEYYISVGKDITKEIHLQETVEDILNHDHVTGLINRRAFLGSLDRFLERARHESELAAVAVINPIDFSSINRAFGFETGNEVLIEIAKRMKYELREYDVIAKLESDKFAVLLKDIKYEENALWILMKLVNVLTKPYIIKDKKITLSFNMGISLYPKDDVTSKGLLEKAMIALVDAKNKGEGSLGFYKSEFEKEAMRKLELRNNLKEALSKNEFLLHYQPYFDSRNGNLVGAEALIRWQKNGKIIPPLEFIPFLEETRMIGEIERWVVETVLKSIKDWQNKGLNTVPISVNISPFSFKNLNFAREIIAILKKYDVREKLINIEIVERLFLDNIKYTKNIMKTLKKYGVSFSIDDFGTGYSSLSYLAKLCVDYVKIDISFVREMLKDNNTKAIVETIVYLSKRLKIKTIAEGVEKNEQLEFLRDIECDFIQGYLFSKPLPEDEFEQVLRKHTKESKKN